MTSRPDEYPIDLLRELDGGQLGWWAKGHYPVEAFAKAVERFADEWNAWPDWRDDAPAIERVRIPVQSVRRLWWRCVPVNDEYGGYEYRPARPGARGAFRVTVTEHHPSVGWDGRTPRRRGCFCPACRVKSQRYYDELNNLTRRRERLAIWRAAAHPELYRHDVVLHDGSDDRHPCRYMRWDDDWTLPHVVQFLERIGCSAPKPPATVTETAA